MLEITLPYPPSVNHYKTVGRVVKTASGRTFQPRVNSLKTKRYYWHVAQLARQSQLEALQGAIECHLEVFPPDNRKRDIDGVLKVCLDSLQHAGILKDDNQIKRLVVEMKAPQEGGAIKATLFSLDS